jgi:hypothetical protein
VLSWNSSCWILCWLLGDDYVLPLLISATHKPGRRIHFSHTYAGNSNCSYRIDNEKLLFTVTVCTYKLLHRIFFSML